MRLLIKDFVRSSDILVFILSCAVSYINSLYVGSGFVFGLGFLITTSSTSSSSSSSSYTYFLTIRFFFVSAFGSTFGSITSSFCGLVFSLINLSYSAASFFNFSSFNNLAFEDIWPSSILRCFFSCFS